MRHPRLRTIALAAPLALGAPLAPASAQPRGRPAVAGELTALYQRFIDAIRARDTVRIRALLTADYVYVGGDSGAVLDRTERLRRDAASTDTLAVFRVYDCDLRVRASVAFGPCWYHLRGRSEGEHGQWDGVSLVTFLKEGDGRWRIAATRPSVSGKPPARHGTAR
jgi:ketosteroid isomerase-like protein